MDTTMLNDEFCAKMQKYFVVKKKSVSLCPQFDTLPRWRNW